MNNRYLFLCISLTIYYYFTPLIFLFENQISQDFIFKPERLYIQKSSINLFVCYSFFSVLLIGVLFLSLKKIFDKSWNKKKNLKFVFLILIIICIFFLIIDIWNLIIYRIENEVFNRTLVYYAVLDKRNTHINILILLAAANFQENKFLSIFSYILLIIFAFLSYSRIELILIISIIFCSIKLNKKQLFHSYLIFFTIISFAVFYRFILSNQSFNYILIDPLHLSLSSMKFLNNFTFDLYSFSYENLKYLLKDFFYINFNLNDFFLEKDLPTYSIRGIDSVVIYLFVFIIYFLIFYLLNKFFFINNYFQSSIFVFLIISLFRGNFVHNLGFIIKLYLLLIILEWLFQKIKLLLSKVG